MYRGEGGRRGDRTDDEGQREGEEATGLEVPETVRTALAPVTVAGETCLEAGAGAGGATLGLLAAGAARVVAVTNDPNHAAAVRDRVTTFERGRSRTDRSASRSDSDRPDADARPATPRATVLYGDLRAVPLADDSVDVITAHALCNVLDPATLANVAAELGRVAAPDARLVVDDYAPRAASGAVAELFAVENAAAWLANGRAAYTFYPATHLVRAFEATGWTCRDEVTLLEPVPWTPELLDAHVEAARETAAALEGPLRESLRARAAAVRGRIDGTVHCGRMYSLQFERA
jgi:SAM-dependent methyltransferase